VQWLDVNTSDEFQVATEHLANDESPEVRAAAAEALMQSDVGAVQPLLLALDDPDPQVVLAALDALEFVGDASIVPQIAPLLKHKDTAVRERTVEAIEFLQ
jgi:HEAT repeat protein